MLQDALGGMLECEPVSCHAPVGVNLTADTLPEEESMRGAEAAPVQHTRESDS